MIILQQVDIDKINSNTTASVNVRLARWNLPDLKIETGIKRLCDKHSVRIFL